MDKEDGVYMCACIYIYMCMCVCVCVCVCVYNGILLSHLSHKKNEIILFATMQVDLKGIMLSEISHRKKNINTI